MSDTNLISIFGYASLLRETANEEGPLVNTAIPCILEGWARNWNASRTLLTEDACPRKRFVNHEFAIVPRFAYASIHQKSGSFVNGVALIASRSDLDSLDFREQGYSRIDVTKNIRPYPGHRLPDHRIYTYVDTGNNDQYVTHRCGWMG